MVKNIRRGNRRTYKIWVEGKAPDVVIETTSRRTRRKDIEEKPSLYAQLGVKEYFLFDPHGEYLDPPLQGHRLVRGEYQRLEHEAERADREAEARQRETKARRATEAELVRLRVELARFRNSST